MRNLVWFTMMLLLSGALPLSAETHSQELGYRGIFCRVSTEDMNYNFKCSSVYGGVDGREIEFRTRDHGIVSMIFNRDGARYVEVGPRRGELHLDFSSVQATSEQARITVIPHRGLGLANYMISPTGLVTLVRRMSSNRHIEEQFQNYFSANGE